MSLFTSSINLPKRQRDGPRTWNCQQAFVARTALELEARGSIPTNWQNVDWLVVFKLTVLAVINNIYDRFRAVVCPRVDEHTLWPCNLIFLQYRVRIHNTFTCYFHQCIPQTPYFDYYIVTGTRKPQFSLCYSSYSALQKPPTFHSPVKATSTEMHESLAAWGNMKCFWGPARVGKEVLHQPLKSPGWEFEITWRFLQKQIKECLRLLYEARFGACGTAPTFVAHLWRLVQVCSFLVAYYTYCCILLYVVCVCVLLHFDVCSHLAYPD